MVFYNKARHFSKSVNTLKNKMKKHTNKSLLKDYINTIEGINDANHSNDNNTFSINEECKTSSRLPVFITLAEGKSVSASSAIHEESEYESNDSFYFDTIVHSIDEKSIGHSEIDQDITDVLNEINSLTKDDISFIDI